MPTVYNPIEFEYWCRDSSRGVDGVELSVNPMSDRPIVLQLEGQDNMGSWMTPDEALELAAKLTEAANAAIRAGKVS